MSIIAILLAALACFVIGFMFHGPLFGKTWMKLANVVPTGNEKFSDMVGQMVWNYVANVVCAVVLFGAIWIASSSSVMGAMTWYKGGIIAAWLWLGFVVWSTSMDVIWMKASWKLWLFEAAHTFVAVVAMGVIIAGLR